MAQYVENMVGAIESEIRNFLRTYVCPATIDSVMEELWTDGDDTFSLHSRIETFIKRNRNGDKLEFDAMELNVGLSDDLKDLWDLRVRCWMRVGKVTFKISIVTSYAVIDRRIRDRYVYENDIQK